MRNSLLVFFIVINFAAFSQEYLLNVQNYTVEDGLANMQAFSAFKDHKGFLWIGTNYGLNRFDGYEFELFTKEQHGLFDNRFIVRIEEDSENNLWLFYMNFGAGNDFQAIDVFNPVSGKATPLQEYISAELPFNLKEILVSKNNTPQSQIWIYDSKGQVFLYKNKAFEKSFENSGKAIHAVSETKTGLMVASEKELFLLDQEGKVLKRDQFPELIHQVSQTDSVIWVTTNKKNKTKENYTANYTVWKRNKQDDAFEIFPFADSDFLKNRKPEFLHRGQNGLWYLNGKKLDEDNPKISVFDPLGKRISNFKTESQNDLPIHSNRVFESSENIWLPSSSGLQKLKISKNPFRIIHTRKDLSDTRGITEDESGMLYFLNGSIFQYNPKTEKIERLTSDKGAFNLVYQDSILHTSFHSQIVSGLHFNLKTGEEKRTPVWKGYTPSITSIKTENTNVYLFGNVKGLSYFDFSTNKGSLFQKYNEFEELKNYAVYHFHENESGVWVATENGVYLLKRGEGIIRRFHSKTNDLPFDHIKHISESPKGVFWLGTSGGGVIRWQPNLEKNKPAEYRQWTTENGLSNNYIYAVHPDDYGSLWIPSDMGLMQMNAADFSIKTYLTEDGLPHNEFNTSSHYRAKDGTFYFGGLGGLISFHPKDFAKEDIFNAPLSFTGFHLWEDGKEQMTDKTKAIEMGESIEIRPGDKLFELKFALLDFDKPENHRYSYKIEGYDERPHLIHENFLRITNLPYGNYQLKIKGQNVTKGWSQQELSVPICILKPFYLQWWFIGTMILGGIGLFFTYIAHRENRLRKEQERLEIEVKNRTQTIQQQTEKLKELDKAKTRFFSNITHEFRTPLTLILGPSEQLAQDREVPTKVRRKIWNIHNNAGHLLSLINQILDISKIESGQMLLEITRGDLVNFTKSQIVSFIDLAHKKEQKLNFTASVEEWETYFDKDKWLKIIFNLISNALKFTGEGGTVNVRLTKKQEEDKDSIQLEVEDNGIGIAPEKLERIFDRFYQTNDSNTRDQEGTGIGLALVKELVELLGGKISVSSKIEEGTRFEILMPVLDGVPQTISEETIEEKVVLKTPVLVKPPMLATIKKADRNSQKLDLLIIEDNQELRSYIRDCIDLEKYNITEAADGEEGIKKAQATIPDLIISDVMMPKKDGFQVTETIRENIITSHIPLVLLTAKSSLENRLQGLKRGADAYLTKPFSPHELALRINKLIEIRQSLQSRYQNGTPLKDNKSTKKEDVFIRKVKAYILENIEEVNLNGEMIGKNFNISRMHLYRKLKALTNESASEIVKKIRLQKAMELLQDEDNDFNISEVTYKCGFSSISYFSKTFKDTFGKPPSEVKR